MTLIEALKVKKKDTQTHKNDEVFLNKLLMVGKTVWHFFK